MAAKSVLRTPIKTVLFWCLIVAATAFLCLGSGMLASGAQLLAQAQQTYTTLAYIEYIGENYPDIADFDSHMVEELSVYDPMPLFAPEQVLAYDRYLALSGTVEGLEVGNRGNREFADAAALVGKVTSLRDGQVTVTVYGEPFYAPSDCGDGKSLILDFANAPRLADNAFQLGQKYVLHGTVYTGEKRLKHLALEPCVLNAPEAYRSLCENPAVLIPEGTEPEDTEAFQMMADIGRTYAVLSDQLTVRVTDMPQNSMEFYLKETELVAGEFYGEAGGCLISEFIAQQLGVSVGDELPLELYAAAVGRSAAFSFWCGDGYLAKVTLPITGIYRNGAGLYTTVFMPGGDAPWLPDTCVDYTVGCAVLANDGVEAYLRAAQPLLLGSMRVTVYDQGYAQAASAIGSLQKTGVLLTSLCGACTLAILLLFGYLFVMKQRPTARVMMNLGTGRGRTVVCLILSAALVLFTAAGVGGVIGHFAGDRVTRTVYENTLARQSEDLRFSDMASAGHAIAFSGESKADAGSSLLAAGSVAAVGLAVCTALSLAAIRPVKAKRKPKAKKRTPPAPVQAPLPPQLHLTRQQLLPKGRSMGAFPLRLVLRCIARGGAKGLIVPSVSLVMVVFIGLFCADLADHRRQLDTVYERVPVTAYVTSNNGRYRDSLGLTQADVRQLTDTGFVESVGLSAKEHYLFIGVSARADGSFADAGHANIPVGGYAAESFYAAFCSQPMLVGTNDIALAPEFRFAGDVVMDYLPGWDESLFAGEEPVCLASEEFLREEGISAGDTLRILTGSGASAGDIIYREYDLKVVGSYPSSTGRTTLYCPLGYFDTLKLRVTLDPIEERNFLYVRDLRNHIGAGGAPEDFPYAEVWEGDSLLICMNEENGNVYGKYNVIRRYGSVSMTLKNTRELEDFKDKLESMGYTTVGTIGRKRLSMVINERQLAETVESLTRHVTHMQALFYVIYAVAAAIGFAVSYLLTRTRRPEFAMMRSMGAGKGCTFFTFWLEQALLFLLGAGAGTGVLAAAGSAFTPLLTASLAGYALCYLVGVAVAAGLMNRLKVLAILGVKE